MGNGNGVESVSTLSWLKGQARWSGSKYRPSWSKRWRARAGARPLNIAVHWLERIGISMADAPKDPIELRAWVRGQLEELSKGAEADKDRIAASIGLLRSLDAEIAADQARVEPSPTPLSVKQDRAYLEAVRAELDAKLEKLDKDSS